MVERWALRSEIKLIWTIPKLHSAGNLLPPNTFTADKEIAYALEVSLIFFRISHNIPIWYD